VVRLLFGQQPDLSIISTPRKYPQGSKPWIVVTWMRITDYYHAHYCEQEKWVELPMELLLGESVRDNIAKPI